MVFGGVSFAGDVLWLMCVPVPLLSISLAFTPTNPAVMNQATGKNSVLINKEVSFYDIEFAHIVRDVS